MALRVQEIAETPGSSELFCDFCLRSLVLSSHLVSEEIRADLESDHECLPWGEPEGLDLLDPPGVQLRLVEDDLS
jgi:hypothetical protein